MKLSVLVLVGMAACGNRHGDPVELLGETIAPPTPFDTLKLGMTVPEAKVALPELEGEEPKAGYAELSVKNVPVVVAFEHARLSRVTMRLERSSFEAELVRRWGPSRAVSKGIVEWNGPVWRANHSCTESGDACAVTFERPRRPLTPAFFGKVPAPPGVLGKLRPGMPTAEAKKIVPDLVGPHETTGLDIGVDDVESATVFADAGNGGVLQIGIRLLTEEAFATLQQAWGAPTPMQRPDEREAHPCWQGDPWRACVTAASHGIRGITFERLVPLAQLLGGGTDIAYAAGSVGLSRAELVAKYGPLDRPEICAGCPRLALTDTEYGRLFLDFEIAADKVTTYDLVVVYHGESSRSAVFAALTAKWGAKLAEPSTKGEQKEMVLRPKAPRVVLRDVHEGTSFAWRISVTP